MLYTNLAASEDSLPESRRQSMSKSNVRPEDVSSLPSWRIALDLANKRKKLAASTTTSSSAENSQHSSQSHVNAPSSVNQNMKRTSESSSLMPSSSVASASTILSILSSRRASTKVSSSSATATESAPPLPCNPPESSSSKDVMSSFRTSSLLSTPAVSSLSAPSTNIDGTENRESLSTIPSRASFDSIQDPDKTESTLNVKSLPTESFISNESIEGLIKFGNTPTDVERNVVKETHGADANLHGQEDSHSHEDRVLGSDVIQNSRERSALSNIDDVLVPSEVFTSSKGAERSNIRNSVDIEIASEVGADNTTGIGILGCSVDESEGGRRSDNNSVTLTPERSLSNDAGNIKLKNAEYFRKMKEEERLQREERESKLDAEQLRRLKESQDVAAKHESSKTAHFAKLGKAFARGSSLLSPGGRGRGNGR